MASSNRIVELDALRGFALLGIIIVNIFVFHAPYVHFSSFYEGFEGVDAMAVEVMVRGFSGKFVLIFAFLFGMGCHLQFTKFASKLGFYSYWVKRMAVLAVFGTLHILGFWFGDILLPYALLGLLLPFFLHFSPKTLIGLAFVFFLSPAIYAQLAQIFTWPSFYMDSATSLEEYIQVFSSGSWSSVFKLRMHEFRAFAPEQIVHFMPKELGFFIAGIAASKISIVQQIQPKKLLFRLVGLAIAVLVWVLFKGEFFALFNPSENKEFIPFLISINLTMEFFHGVLYIIFGLCIFKIVAHSKPVEWLASIGKMSLTNYILQSVFCIAIFYSYGLGFYGQVRPLHLLGIAVVIYIIQIVFSSLWLRFFKQGPLEWLWRRLSRL